MSNQLLYVVITLLLIALMTLGGILYSYLTVSKGLWENRRFQKKKRAAGSYKGSLPIIFSNLAIYSTLAAVGLYSFHDLIIGESFFGLSMPLPLQVALEIGVQG